MHMREVSMEEAYNTRLEEFAKKRRDEDDRKRQYEEMTSKRRENLRKFFSDTESFFRKKGFNVIISDNDRRYEVRKNRNPVLAAYYDDEYRLHLEASFICTVTANPRDPDELVDPIGRMLAEYDEAHS